MDWIFLEVVLGVFFGSESGDEDVLVPFPVALGRSVVGEALEIHHVGFAVLIDALCRKDVEVVVQIQSLLGGNRVFVLERYYVYDRHGRLQVAEGWG